MNAWLNYLKPILYGVISAVIIYYIIFSIILPSVPFIYQNF